MVEVDILRTFSSAESIFKLNGIAKNAMVDRYLLCQLRRSQKWSAQKKRPTSIAFYCEHKVAALQKRENVGVAWNITFCNSTEAVFTYATLYFVSS